MLDVFRSPETEAFLIEELEHIEILIDNRVNQRKDLNFELACITKVVSTRFASSIEEIAITLLDKKLNCLQVVPYDCKSQWIELFISDHLYLHVYRRLVGDF
jgi:hypothetical protein